MLAVNKESMWIDPIDWSAFKEDLSDWSEQNCPNLTINSIIDLKFSERLVPSHSPRTCAHGTEGSTKIYQFFSLTPPRHDNLKEMEMKGVPVHIAKLIYNISKHNPLLSTLGIHPNQLRNILKLWTPNFEEAFDDIAFTLFVHGYQIWKVRKSMMSRYWKSIAQEEWKPHPIKRKKETSIIQEQKKCRSPFHFLERHLNLCKQRPTPCPCSHDVIATPPVHKTQDIREFFHQHSQSHPSYTLKHSESKFKTSYMRLYHTREDHVRGEHPAPTHSNPALFLLLSRFAFSVYI
ncbi:MAG: hypothetical protein ACRDF4_08230, partial [Rhabdochlamydiaceae bacterium]